MLVDSLVAFNPYHDPVPVPGSTIMRSSRVALGVVPAGDRLVWLDYEDFPYQSWDVVVSLPDTVVESEALCPLPVG